MSLDADRVQVPVPTPRSAVSRMASIRRLRSRRMDDEEIEVDVSPLIDCVFLLLIFFLVTTMLKKMEKQIPVMLPDYTSALSSVAESPVLIYALDEKENIYRADGIRRDMGGLKYHWITDFSEDLKVKAEEKGAQQQIRIDTDRNVTVQKIVDVLDTLSLQGFENVGVRLRHREDLFFELKDMARGH